MRRTFILLFVLPALMTGLPYATALILAALVAVPVIAQSLPPGIYNAPPMVVGDNESIDSDTTLNVFDGGSVGDYFEAGISDGSSTNVLVNISGGIVGSGFDAHSDSTVNISGGTIGDIFHAHSGSTVNISGTEFFVNGVLIELELGVPTVIADRRGRLRGLLADGNPFDFDLSSIYAYGQDYFASNAMLTLILVPEPPSVLIALFRLVAAGFARRR